MRFGSGSSERRLDSVPARPYAYTDAERARGRRRRAGAGRLGRVAAAEAPYESGRKDGRRPLARVDGRDPGPTFDPAAR